MKDISRAVFRSPAGPLVLYCDGGSIIRLLLPNGNAAQEEARLRCLLGPVRFTPPSPAAEAVCHELADYFTGRLRAFSVPVAFAWGTPFSQAVWHGVARIPYGQTASYAALAQGCGVRGARAVGNAVGRNPVPILVPCHRVLRRSGAIGGFGGGVVLKEWLLRLEGVALP